MTYISGVEQAHRHRRKQQLLAARELSVFGSKEIAQELEASPDDPELARLQFEQKLVAEEKLRRMNLKRIEETRLASTFNWIRDGEHSNKLCHS